MKVLFLTDNFIPETNAPAHRTFEHTKEWVRQGAEVTVITCAPNFPYGKVYNGYKNKLYQTEYIEGVKVIRVWSFMAENKGFVKRVLDFCSFMVTSFVAGLFVRTDLIVATSPQFFTAISGRWLAFWRRKRWVMEVRDLWPESLKVVGMMGDNVAIRFFEHVEHRLYRSAWKIVTVTKSMEHEIVTKHKVPAQKVKVIRNGVDLKKFKPAAKDLELIAELDLTGNFIIGYIGTHGMAHALDFILKAATEIKNEKVHFLFVGSGAAKPDLLKLHANLHLNNVTFLDSVPKDEVKRYLSILDAGLVNLKNSPVFLGALPSKMNELAAMKIPILLGLKGEAEQFVLQNNLGLSFIPEDKASFLLAVQELVGRTGPFNMNTNTVRTMINRPELAIQMLDFLKE